MDSYFCAIPDPDTKTVLIRICLNLFSYHCALRNRTRKLSQPYPDKKIYPIRIFTNMPDPDTKSVLIRIRIRKMFQSSVLPLCPFVNWYENCFNPDSKTVLIRILKKCPICFLNIVPFRMDPKTVLIWIRIRKLSQSGFWLLCPSGSWYENCLNPDSYDCDLPYSDTKSVLIRIRKFTESGSVFLLLRSSGSGFLLLCPLEPDQAGR